MNPTPAVRSSDVSPLEPGIEPQEEGESATAPGAWDLGVPARKAANNATFVHDDAPRSAPPPAEPASPAPKRSAAPSAAPRTGKTVDLSRMTVLPRVEAADAGEKPKLVGDERERFEPLGEIGEGGLGTVVAARDLDIGRRVAIKKIRADRQSHGAFLRFVQEVRTVGKLDHPNITPIHDVGKDDQGAFYFVMKYVDGESLETLIEKLQAGDPATLARLGFEQRVQIFLQVLHAVDFAHARGIVHRDLKPANIMIGHHGEVQLLDWGVAKQLDQADLPADPGAVAGEGSLAVTKTRSGQLVGTPKYMSPEQARGETVDVRADTWALSMLFLELLYLKHPLDGKHSLDEVLDALKAWTKPTPLTCGEPGSTKQGQIPAELSWYATDGLHPDPAKRYQTVKQMIDRMERRNAGDYPIQCPCTLQKRALASASRVVDRRPILTASIAMAAFAGLGALVLTAVGSVATAGVAVLAAVLVG